MTEQKTENAVVQLPSTAQEQASAMLTIFKEVAMSPDAGSKVDVIRAMMEMQRELQKDQAERALNEALARLAPKLPRIKRTASVQYAVDKNNPKGPKETAFKFSRYEDIDKAIRPLLSEEGLSLSFTTAPRTSEGGGLIVRGRLSHVQGAFREAEISVALDSSGGKNNIQAMGSSSSYGKRYVACMLLNIITENEDDDGASAELQFVTVEQADDLDTRVRAFGADAHKKFLIWLKVESLDKLPTQYYKKALNFIVEKETAKKVKV